MAIFRLTAPSTEDLELVCLSLAGDGRVLWGNAAGRALGREQHPAAHFLIDLVHRDDEMIARDLLDEANRQGHAQRIIRLKDTECGSRFLHLKMFKRQDESSPGQTSSQVAATDLVAQGWDVTDLVVRQRELETHLQDPLMSVPNQGLPYSYSPAGNFDVENSRTSARSLGASG